MHTSCQTPEKMGSRKVSKWSTAKHGTEGKNKQSFGQGHLVGFFFARRGRGDGGGKATDGTRVEAGQSDT
jgi:hypothetical protein